MHDAVRVQVAHALCEVTRQLDPHRPRQLYRLVSQELLQAASIDELEQTRSSVDIWGILATRTTLDTIQTTMAETKNHGGDIDHCIHKVHGINKDKKRRAQWSRHHPQYRLWYKHGHGKYMDHGRDPDHSRDKANNRHGPW